MNIFNILGPVMVGPSSSHTAGAVRIGYITRMLLGCRPVQVNIGLHGSFAATGKGHGTDRAIVAGLLGMKPDDERIPGSIELAEEEGLQFTIKEVELSDAHPNTALLHVRGENGEELEVQASSLGGGRIMVNKIDGITINCSGEVPTLIVYNEDRPGIVSKTAFALSEKSVNIAALQLVRDKRGGCGIMVIETDQHVPEESVQLLEEIDGIMKVIYLDVH